MLETNKPSDSLAGLAGEIRTAIEKIELPNQPELFQVGFNDSLLLASLFIDTISVPIEPQGERQQIKLGKMNPFAALRLLKDKMDLAYFQSPTYKSGVDAARLQVIGKISGNDSNQIDLLKKARQQVFELVPDLEAKLVS